MNPIFEFAVLVGSQADRTAQPDSDWDIALQWDAQLDWLTVLGKTETLRRKISGSDKFITDFLLKTIAAK